jgi:hypothetical protein
MSLKKDTKSIKKEIKQKEKHKEYKYYNEKEEKSHVSVSQFDIGEEFLIQENKEKVPTDKELELNFMLSNIAIGEVI